jgi:hypothetical protein
VTRVVIVDADGHQATLLRSHWLVLGLRRIGIRVDACGGSGTGAARIGPVSGAVRRALDSGAGRLVLVLLGDESAQQRLVWEVALAGLLPSVRLVVHADAARIPYEPSLAEVFARADVVVTDADLGARAVRRCSEEAGGPAPRIAVLSPALPPEAGLPGPGTADRRTLRRARLGVGDDAVVVGCWVGDGPEEVAALALHIFHRFSGGHYLRCDACGRVTPWSEDDRLRPVRLDHCATCGSTSGVVGPARDDSRLVLVGEPASEDGLWDARAIVRHLGLEDRVVHEPVPTSSHDLAKLWGCVDVHLQPHLLADLPLSMRVSCALGVPIVATGHGAVEERLAGAASLVPPRMVLDHTDGHRIALMDPGGALVELCRLSDDPPARRLASTRLRERAGTWEDATRLDGWIDLLEAEVASSSEVPCSTW